MLARLVTPKLIFSEISEEMTKDGSDMSEEDGDGEDCFDTVFASNKFHVPTKSEFLNSIIIKSFSRLSSARSGHSFLPVLHYG